MNSSPVPSFILMAIQGDDIVIFVYMWENDELKIEKLDLGEKK